MIAELKGMNREDALRKLVELNLCWDNEAAADDAGLIPRSSPAFGEWLKQETAAGRLHRIAVTCGGVRNGTGWVSIKGDRLHIVAAALQPGGPDRFLQVLPILEKAARKLGCKTISCHTARPGLMNRLSKAGFGLGEALLIKNI